MNPDFRTLLKQHNLSLTSARLAVLETLHHCPHSDAQTIFTAVQKMIPSITIQAVYNNLNALTGSGIIQEIKPKGKASLYETRVGDNHHHIVCRTCGRIEDKPCVASAPCVAPDNEHGFIVDEAEVIFWGVCPACQKSKSKSKPKHKTKA